MNFASFMFKTVFSSSIYRGEINFFRFFTGLIKKKYHVHDGIVWC